MKTKPTIGKKAGSKPASKNIKPDSEALGAPDFQLSTIQDEISEVEALIQSTEHMSDNQLLDRIKLTSARAGDYAFKARLSATQTLLYVWASGTLLNTTKKKLGHGNFGKWCDTHIVTAGIMSERTCQRYMKLATENPDVSAFLEQGKSIRQSYIEAGVIAEPEEAPATAVKNGATKSHVLSGRSFIARWVAIENTRVELCKTIAELVDRDKFEPYYINREFPRLSVQMLKRMERVGRSDYHPALLTPITPAEVMLSKMDYQEQVRGLEPGATIPVATIDEKTGERGVRVLPLMAITKDQSNQVSREVDGKRVFISVDEQYAWLVDHRTNLATRPSRKDKPKWKIQDGIAWIGGIPFSAAEIAAIQNALLNPPEPVVSVSEVISPAPPAEQPPAAEKRKPLLGDLLKR